MFQGPEVLLLGGELASREWGLDLYLGGVLVLGRSRDRVSIRWESELTELLEDREDFCDSLLVATRTRATRFWTMSARVADQGG